jgi:hypothetical protein
MSRNTATHRYPHQTNEKQQTLSGVDGEKKNITILGRFSVGFPLIKVSSNSTYKHTYLR